MPFNLEVQNPDGMAAPHAEPLETLENVGFGEEYFGQGESNESALGASTACITLNWAVHRTGSGAMALGLGICMIRNYAACRVDGPFGPVFLLQHCKARVDQDGESVWRGVRRVLTSS
jgi:hypothetical protein